MWRNYEALGRLRIRKALAMLREDARGTDYHPPRPVVTLSDGSILRVCLRGVDCDGELIGCWVAVRYHHDGRVLRRYSL